MVLIRLLVDINVGKQRLLPISVNKLHLLVVKDCKRLPSYCNIAYKPH